MTMNKSGVFYAYNSNAHPSQQVYQVVGNEQPTLPYLIDKIADVALKNEGSALIVASGIATGIIIYVIAKSAAEIIKAWRIGK